jgi:hypothetical protein
MSDQWEPPRCRHGRILLGCEHDDCPENNAYVVLQEVAIDLYRRRQINEFRRAFGVPGAEDWP